MITEEVKIKTTMTQTAEGEFLIIEVPATSIPPSLRSGKEIADSIKRFLEETERAHLEKRLNRFLKRAHEAETNGNYFRAGRAFVLALFCEGRQRNEVTDVCEYVRHAMPVY
jgi:hypothetical protein